MAHQTTPQPQGTVLATFTAGHPRGSRPAEEAANAYRAAGQPATVIMNLASDEYVVKAGA
ncbi:hypothetical protein [Streptomyces sp. NPDC008150]|uniref:hypothetical protein n=1 Tax=Streptomyces sp. NPDC008150 TaxID=3364816 RepID=UPI0036E59588